MVGESLDVFTKRVLVAKYIENIMYEIPGRARLLALLCRGS